MHGLVYAGIYNILYNVHIRVHVDVLGLYHMLTCSVIPIIPNMDTLYDL